MVEYQTAVPPAQERPSLKGWLIFVLLVALIFGGTATYFILENKQLQTELSTAPSSNVTLAFNQGVVASIIQLMKSTDQCQVASIKYYNATRQIVDINCVRQLLAEQNVTLK